MQHLPLELSTQEFSQLWNLAEKLFFFLKIQGRQHSLFQIRHFWKDFNKISMKYKEAIHQRQSLIGKAARKSSIVAYFLNLNLKSFKFLFWLFIRGHKEIINMFLRIIKKLISLFWELWSLMWNATVQNIFTKTLTFIITVLWILQRRNKKVTKLIKHSSANWTVCLKKLKHCSFHSRSKDRWLYQAY